MLNPGIFTITCGGVTKTAADWGIYGLRRRRMSRGVDTVSFTVSADVDGAEPFASGAILSVSLDGTQFFYGLVMPPTLRGSGTGHSMDYVIRGPWHWLEEIVFKMPYYVYTGGGFVTDYCGHVILNWSSPTSLLTIGQQITSVLQYAINLCLAPLQIGNIEPGVALPLDEIRDRSCAEIILKQLRMVPDAQTWFDYTTTPPTLHVRKASDLGTATVLYGDALDEADVHYVSSVELQPRRDLQRPAVCITYEGKGQYDGKEYTRFFHDFWPALQPGGLPTTGRERSALNISIELQAPNVSFAKMTLHTESIDGDDATDVTRVAWWKKRVPWLARPEITDIEVPIAKVNRKVGSLLLPNEIRQGSIAEWMPMGKEEDSIASRIKFTQYDKDITDPTKKVLRKEEDYPVNVTLNTTDGPLGETFHQSVQSWEDGDPVPAMGAGGLANYIFTKLATLQFSGTVRLAENEVTFKTGMGQVLTIQGGKPEWSGMLIESVEEDFDAGTTSVTVGPSAFLQAQSIVELLKFSRPRRRWTNSATMATGGAAASKISLGKEGANTDTVPGKGQVKELVVRHDETNYVYIRGQDPYLLCAGEEIHLCDIQASVGCCKWA